jgi:hypothetical protein
MATATNTHNEDNNDVRRGARFAVAAWLLLVASGCTSTWSRGEKALAAGYVAANVVDMGQTNYALQNGYAEGNPMYGSAPSAGKILAIKGVTTAATMWMADRFPSRRKLILGMGLGLQAGIVGNNARYVGFSFKWTSGGSTGSTTAASGSAAPGRLRLGHGATPVREGAPGNAGAGIPSVAGLRTLRLRPALGL